MAATISLCSNTIIKMNIENEATRYVYFFLSDYLAKAPVEIVWKRDC